MTTTLAKIKAYLEYNSGLIFHTNLKNLPAFENILMDMGNVLMPSGSKKNRYKIILYATDTTLKDTIEEYIRQFPKSSLGYEQGFEDAAPASWTYSNAARDATYKVGGSYSVKMGAPAAAGYAAYTFAAADPWEVEVNVRTDGSGYSQVTFREGGTQKALLYFRPTDNKIVTSSTAIADYVANKWYNLKFKNINYTAKTWDIYLDDVLIYSGTHGAGTTFDNVYLQETGTASYTWYDDFKLNAGLEDDSVANINSNYMFTSAIYDVYSIDFEVYH